MREIFVIFTESGKCWEVVSSGTGSVIGGIGAFGEVRMCVHRETGAQRAVKVLRKNHMDEDEKRMLFNEINILKELVCRAQPLSALSLFSYFLYLI